MPPWVKEVINTVETDSRAEEEKVGREEVKKEGETPAMRDKRAYTFLLAVRSHLFV